MHWQNKEYDDTFKPATVELDPVKRAALLIKCNDLVVRPDVAAEKTGSWRNSAAGTATHGIIG